ncbi:MAG: hypothetical protein NTX58_12690, partial [Actinobacteria bacterium]|nr:hypothetical protein [Actinomycetota bacterium]
WPTYDTTQPGKNTQNNSHIGQTAYTHHKPLTPPRQISTNKTPQKTRPLTQQLTQPKTPKNHP